jgi:acetyl esterase/lipase
LRNVDIAVDTHSYGPHPECVADLRLPRAGARGCVVLLHGGYWRHAYRRDLMEPMAVALAHAGVATWNVEYRRLGSGGGVPQTVDDVAAAIDHLTRISSERGIALGPIVLVGHSAGAHLALTAAGRHRHRGSPASSPAAVVSLGGVCDLEEAARAGLSDGAAVAFTGGRPEAWPLLYADASPPHLLPFGIPYLLLHGTADDAVPWTLSANLHERARLAGDRGDLLLLPGVGHFEAIDPSTMVFASVRAWIDDVLAATA